MANRKFMTLVSIVALVLSASAAGADISAGNGLGPNHVPGEKLDSGLGDLRPEWPGEKQQGATLREPGGSPTSIAHRVPGEKLDSGLGELPPYHRSGDTWHRWVPEKIADRASR